MEETTGLFTVVFPDHHDKLADGLWNLFRSHQAVDFDLRWAGRSIRAHRLILDVFLSPDKLARCGQQMNHGDSHPDPPTVEAGLEAYLPSTNYLDCLLEFLYRGRITVGEETLERLLELAGELDLRVLMDAIKSVWNGRGDSVQNDSKRRPRKGIPVKLSNTEDLDQTVEDQDESDQLEVVRVKRGRGRPKRSGYKAGVKRTAVAKRKKREPSESKGNEASGEENGKPPAKKCKMVRSKKAAKDPNLLRKSPGYMRMWLERQPLLRCQHCPYETRRQRSFRIHQAKHDKTAPVFRCNVCGVAFMTEEGMERHTSTQHATALSSYSCQLCHYSNPMERNLKKHMLTIHRLNAKGEPVVKSYDCSHCSYSSAIASQLAIHEMIHNPVKPIQCDQCTYSCTRKYELIKHHKAVHLNERPFLCVQCGHKSASNVHLSIHMMTHTDEHPFVCGECGQAFKLKAKLKLHAVRHQGDQKAFTCGICGVSVYRRDNLQRHMKQSHNTTIPK